MRIVFLYMQGVFISLFTPKVTEFSAERLPRGLIPPTKTLPDLIAERIVDLDSLAMEPHEFSLGSALLFQLFSFPHKCLFTDPRVRKCSYHQ